MIGHDNVSAPLFYMFFTFNGYSGAREIDVQQRPKPADIMDKIPFFVKWRNRNDNQSQRKSVKCDGNQVKRAYQGIQNPEKNDFQTSVSSRGKRILGPEHRTAKRSLQQIMIGCNLYWSHRGTICIGQHEIWKSMLNHQISQI